MPQTLTIQDQTLGNEVQNSFSLDVLTEHITVRELIRSRVYQEAKDHNLRLKQNPAEDFASFASPVEAALNKPKPRRTKQVDWKEQYGLAVQAVEKGRILILVGDRQVEDLDEDIEVRTDTVVTFLRLTLLAGG